MLSLLVNYKKDVCAFVCAKGGNLKKERLDVRVELELLDELDIIVYIEKHDIVR